jgi:hypothetical protein
VIRRFKSYPCNQRTAGRGSERSFGPFVYASGPCNHSCNPATRPECRLCQLLNTEYIDSLPVSLMTAFCTNTSRSPTQVWPR